MAEQGVFKVCVVCKCDLAGVPRTKDKHGKYFCNPCYEKALKAKHDRQARERNAQSSGSTHHASHADLDALLPNHGEGTGELLDELVAPPPPKPMPRPHDPRECPNCNHVLEVGAVMCTNCGYNLASGVALKVNIPSATNVRVPKRTSTTVWAVICALLGGIGLLANFMVLSGGAILASLDESVRPSEFSIVLSLIGAMGLTSVGVLMFLRNEWSFNVALATFIIALGNSAYGLLSSLISPPEDSQSAYAAGLVAGQLIIAGVAMAVVAIFYLLLLRHLRSPATRVEFGTR
jgi:uncharacterized Zn finger protein (UPF0148 family)